MYSTDLTEIQWQFIKNTLDLGDIKRKYDLKIIWNAINYLVKTGCQRRMLPQDFQNGNWFIITIVNGQIRSILIYYYQNFEKKFV